MTGKFGPMAAVCTVALILAGSSGTAATSARGGSPSRTCSDRIPHGAAVMVAWRTAELFVADVILDRDPLCGYDMSTARLRGGLPLRPFSRGFPPVPIARASRDPDADEAVYMLSRRFAAFAVLGADGRREIPLSVGVAAPRVGSGAYDLVLVLEHGSWRVDRATRVRIVER